MCVTSCHQFAENMVTAQKRDAARQGQFYFRKKITPPESDTEEEDGDKECAQCCPDEYTLMSADTIINGKVPATLCVYLYTHLHYVHTPQRDRNSQTAPHSLSLPGRVPWSHPPHPHVPQLYQHRCRHPLHYPAVPLPHLTAGIRYRRCSTHACTHTSLM